MATEKINWAQAFEYHETLREFSIHIMGTYARLAMHFPTNERYSEWEQKSDEWNTYRMNLHTLVYYDEQDAINEKNRLAKVMREVHELEKSMMATLSNE